jgi:hypothetical protein
VLADAVTLVVTWAAYLAVLVAAAYAVTWPVLWGVGRRRAEAGRARGWQPWLAWSAAAAFAALAVLPLSANVERRTRVAKAHGDVLLIGKALAAYAAHCGGPPPAGADSADCPVATTPQIGTVPGALLKTQRNARGMEVEAFLEFVPRLPPGWSGVAGVYAYVVEPPHGARVCGAGDGVVADSRAAAACP